MLPSFYAVADVCQATVGVAMMCLLVLASQPGPLLDGHVRGGGSAAVVPRRCPLHPLTLPPPLLLSLVIPAPVQPHPHTLTPRVIWARAQALNLVAGRTELGAHAPKLGSALHLSALLEGCAVGVHLGRAARAAAAGVQPPRAFRCAPTSCPYAPSTCASAPCKGRCRSRHGGASLPHVAPRSARTHHPPHTPTPPVCP